MPLRLMCLTAHPDDEAGAFGGALLKAADAGVETAVFCLTEGSAGSYREEGQSDEELAELRRAEFYAACKALGVRDAKLLNYPDGGLWQQPFLELAGLITREMRRFRPHMVLTFGGEGGVNLHRDHTMISLVTTAAFHWSGRSSFFPEQLEEYTVWAPQKLYYSATRFLSTPDPEARAAGALVPVSLTYWLSSALREGKLRAFAEHRTQKALLERVLAEFGEAFEREDYLLVAARQPKQGEQELWDGVDLLDEKAGEKARKER